MKRFFRVIGVIAIIGACAPLQEFKSALPKISFPQRSIASDSGNPADFAPRGHVRLLNDTEYGFRYASINEPVRRGRLSERFELRSDDCGGSDCGNPRYRSEIREDTGQSRARIGQDNWIGWSFYNANIGSMPPDRSLKTVFGQWKVDGDIPAALRLMQVGVGEGHWTTCDPAICNRSTDAGKDVVLQLDDMQITNRWGTAQNNGYICKLFSMEANRGKWVDIVLNTNFSDTPDGYLRMWVNGEQVCNYRGRIIASNAELKRIQPNHRRGIFVNYTTRWDQATKGAPRPTLIAYYDEFLAGQTRDAVDTRLREQAGKPPKD